MTDRFDVLVVEDNPADAFLISELLNDAGIRVNIQVVNDGQKALDALSQMRSRGSKDEPDMIFLDLNIPKVHGFEVLRRIRISPEHRHLPVVVMTGSRNKDDEIRVRGMGVTDYRIKPGSAAEMDDTVSWLRQNVAALAEGMCERGNSVDG
jgi:CheY-like chemotaxis protein